MSGKGWGFLSNVELDTKLIVKRPASCDENMINLGAFIVVYIGICLRFQNLRGSKTFVFNFGFGLMRMLLFCIFQTFLLLTADTSECQNVCIVPFDVIEMTEVVSVGFD